MQEISVAELDLARLAPLVGPEQLAELAARAGASRAALGDRRIWNVNSTATGGGVAEMLSRLVAYTRGAGVDGRWLVTTGNSDFFRLTKRIHNNLHGSPGDGGPLGPVERAVYDATTAENLAVLRRRVDPGDIVILHDPQTVGLTQIADEVDDVSVIWRCHVGTDDHSPTEQGAWEFLRPYMGGAQVHVFTRAAYAPAWLAPERLAVIPPSIDPFAVKNAPMSDEQARAVLSVAGLLDVSDPSAATFVRDDGSPGVVKRQAVVVREGGPAPVGTRVVVQVSRWDRLKDMAGVLEGFARGVSDEDAHLWLIGPDVSKVADDPEGQQVLAECTEAWHGLPDDVRRRCALISVPMVDIEENAAIVNAAQRYASIVAQKSIREGFGLTVTEAMWKARPVVASAVGGIVDQIVDGDSGLLLPDPADVTVFGELLRRILADPELAERLGKGARRRVTEMFLPDRHLEQWIGVLVRLGVS